MTLQLLLFDHYMSTGKQVGNDHLCEKGMAYRKTLHLYCIKKDNHITNLRFLLRRTSRTLAHISVQ